MNGFKVVLLREKQVGFLDCINPTTWCESHGGRAQAQVYEEQFIPLPLKCTISILICEHIPECEDKVLEIELLGPRACIFKL